MANIYDILNNPVNLPLRYRGSWQPSTGNLPSTVTFPNGSVLRASDTGVISTITYLQNSFLINVQGTWVAINNIDSTITNAPIEYITDIEAGDNLDDYTGVRGTDFIYQIITITPDLSSNISNIPIDFFLGGMPGVCEVFGEINVQRYTTTTGRLFSRVLGTPNEPWTEISVDLETINSNYENLVDSLSNTYSISGISSV